MDYVDRARADLERLDETIRRAQETIQRATRERDDIATFIRLHERYSKGGTAPVVAATGIPSKADVIRVKAMEFIATHGQRMSIQSLFDQMTAAGVEIAGAQPKGNLAGILSRDDRFTYSKETGGWWLAGEPEPTSLVAAVDMGDVGTRTDSECVLDESDEAPRDDVGGASDDPQPPLSFHTRAAA